MDNLSFQLKPNLVLNHSMLLELLLNNRGLHIVTLNLHHIYLCRKKQTFLEMINNADYITCDGWPILSLYRKKNSEIKKVTGSDFFEHLVFDPSYSGFRIGLIGGSESDVAVLKHLLVLNSNYFDFELTTLISEWNPGAILNKLKSVDLDLLLISAPVESAEKFIFDMKQAQPDKRLTFTIINIGAGLAMLTGSEKRSPRFLRFIRAEWCWRLFQNPKKFMKRYLLQDLGTFVTVVLPSLLRMNTQPNIRKIENDIQG